VAAPCRGRGVDIGYGLRHTAVGIDLRRAERLHELRAWGRPRDAVRAVRGELGIGREPHASRPELEVEPRVLRRRRHHREALDAERLQLALERPDLRDLPPAERAPESD